MRGRGRGVRRRLNYATVVSAITAFVVLCGGAAFAANQLAKNSVGKKQLKANSVTTAKVKKNAVTAAKIKAGAVDGTKVKTGGLTGADFQLDGMPYTRITNELRLNTDVVVPTGEPSFTQLPGLSYTQEAGRTDQYIGAIDVEFSSSCVERSAAAYLLMDAPPDLKFGPLVFLYAVATGNFGENGGGQATRRINLGPYLLGSKFAPTSPQNHSFSVLLIGGCNTGSGITAKSFSVDVIGTKK